MNNDVETRKEFVFLFEEISSDRTETITVSDANTRTDAYQKAREEVSTKHNLDIRAFESSWRLEDTKCNLSFRNSPWSSYEELETDIQGINGVKNMKYIPLSYRSYGPPRFYVSVESTASLDEVTNDIKNYFAGLRIDSDAGSGFFVIVDPTEFTD